MTETVDRSIDAAVEAYVLTCSGALRGKDFVGEIAHFVLHVCDRCRFPASSLSAAEALSIAVELLDHGYAGHMSGGFEHALLDVTGGQAEIQSVLTWIAEALKSRRRQMYRRWIFSRYVEGLGWNVKRALVAVIAELDGDPDDGVLAVCNSSRLADHAVALIEAHLAANAIFRDSPSKSALA